MTWGHFFEVWIGLKSDLIKINRKTDSLLDWLGDCGGFMESLKLIGEFLVSSYSGYALKYLLALNFVRFVPSSLTDKPKNKVKEFKQKYMTSESDPKKSNLLQSLLENFGID